MPGLTALGAAAVLAWAPPHPIAEGAWPKVGAGGGDVVAVWGDEHGTVSAAFGPAFTEPVTLARPAGEFGALPKLAVGPRGDMVVAAGGPCDGCVSMATRPSAALRPITRTSALRSQRFLRVAADRVAAVLWTEPSSHPVQLSLDGRPPRSVAPRGANHADVSVTGRTVRVVWARAGRIEMRVDDGPVRRLSRGRGNQDPHIAGDTVAWSAGPRIVVWRDGRRFSLRARERFSVAPVVATAGGRLLTAFLGCGTRDCWTHGLGHQGGRLYVARGRRVVPLTGPGTRVLDPDVSLLADGRSLVVFNQGDPSARAGDQEFRRAWAAFGTAPPQRLSGGEFVDYNGAVDGALTRDGAVVVWSGTDGAADPRGTVYATSG